LIESLAVSLAERGHKGTSATNLRKFRAFYEAYPEIQQTMPVESVPALIDPSKQEQQTTPLASWKEKVAELSRVLAGYFKLGWSHYVTLLTSCFSAVTFFS